MLLRRLLSSAAAAASSLSKMATPSLSLTPAQWAFFRRSFPALLETTSTKLNESQLLATLQAPPEQLITRGRQVLRSAAQSYLSRRFPRLKELKGAQERGSDLLFGAESNLHKLSRMVGLESLTHQGRCDEAAAVGTGTVDALLALIGLMEQHLGPESAASWLQSRYFSNALFSPASLLPPALLAYPIPELTTLLRVRTGNPAAELQFRLHQESGRYSNDSMFVVGVYAPESGCSAADASMKLIGEGAGASIALAQRRAAIDALKRDFLLEQRVD